MNNGRKLIKMYKQQYRDGINTPVASVALFNLGLIYECGKDGVRVSTSKAIKYYKKAAKLGNADACYRLACIYFAIRKHKKKAIALVKQAAENNVLAAQVLYFDLIYKHTKNIQESEHSAELLQRAARANFAPALYRQAFLKLFGIYAYVPLSKIACVLEYEYPAEWTTPETAYVRSTAFRFKANYQKYLIDLRSKYTVLFDRLTQPFNIRLALQLLDKAAAQGNASAQYALATFYEYGRGVKVDLARAFELYLKAADQGNILAQVRVAQLYSAQKATSRDMLNLAIEYYHRAGTFFKANKEYKKLKRYRLFHKN